MKIHKWERIFFDGEYMSNGHWLCKADDIKLPADLKPLVIAGVKFMRDNGILQSGDDIKLPDLKAVMPKRGDIVDTFFRTELLKAIDTRSRTQEYGRVFVNSYNTAFVLVNDRYAQGLGASALDLSSDGKLQGESNGSTFIVLPLHVPEDSPEAVLLKPVPVDLKNPTRSAK